jgi:Kef-type K+ transport system membrane component KefB
MDGTTQTLLTLGGLLLVGLLADEGSRRIGLPSVTILLVMGFVAGPEALDVLPDITDSWFPIVSTIALTLVGFLLGAEFRPERLRAEGRSHFVIALVQGVVTALVVAAGLLVAGVEVELALVLAGIAVATAPAATLAVVQERRSEGPFTRALLAVVAIDDVIALSVFGLMASAAAYLGGDAGDASLLVETVWEVLGAVGLGLAIGFPAAALTGRLRAGTPTQEEAYAVVLLCAGAAEALDVSFLLASVVVGATIANRAGHHDTTFREIERIEWPALIVFFVLAGASLEISSIRDIGWLGAGYVLLRALGKISGCSLGARLVGLPGGLERNLGKAMLPQAGVAIGLSLLAAERFPEIADDVVAVVIAATVVFELTGPIMTRRALDAVGESGAAELSSEA